MQLKIILDVNIILSAIIKDSITRKVIFESGHTFYFPEYAFKKIEKYKDYILAKSGLEAEEFSNLLKSLFKHIEIISTGNLADSWEKSMDIIEKIDSEDVVFIAAALTIQDAAIWSDDNHFDKQNAVKVLKTKDMIEFIKGK